jgi:CheY-like chemotaxis protein/HPt (histidine-containing phosphotransfer) domain-containing protein
LGNEPATKIAGSKILLVEDNPVNREVATQMLAAMRCEVQEVANGKEAVEIVRREDFDLALMDCEMPVMDGYAATKAIREWERDSGDHRHLPIVALTAHVLPEDRRRCNEAGMDGYLSKPFSMDSLRTALKDWLSSSDQAPPVDEEQDSVSESAPNWDAHETLSESVLETISALDPESGKELADRVISLYQTSSAELIDSLAEALDANDRNTMRTGAHALKSSSGNVGAERLVEMCREMETAARENGMQGMPDRFSAIRREHENVLKKLDTWAQG